MLLLFSFFLFRFYDSFISFKSFLFYFFYFCSALSWYLTCAFYQFPRLYLFIIAFYHHCSSSDNKGSEDNWPRKCARNHILVMMFFILSLVLVFLFVLVGFVVPDVLVVLVVHAVVLVISCCSRWSYCSRYSCS